jgi:hypothetical protein
LVSLVNQAADPGPAQYDVVGELLHPQLAIWNGVELKEHVVPKELNQTALGKISIDRADRRTVRERHRPPGDSCRERHRQGQAVENRHPGARSQPL